MTNQALRRHLHVLSLGVVFLAGISCSGNGENPLTKAKCANNPFEPSDSKSQACMSCVTSRCDAELSACYGPGYRQASFSGPCAGLANCLCGCVSTDRACASACTASRTSACSTCQRSFQACSDTCSMSGSCDFH